MTNNDDKLYIVMPAYNEEENIINVIKQWYPKLQFASNDSKIVVADSGSTDMTHEILSRICIDFPQVEVFTDCEKQHGPKVIALYKYAINNKADYIFQTDSDGQTNPDEFDSFWEKRKSYNAIIGKRSSRGDGKQRAFVEKVVCFLLKVYFGVSVPDANAPFRLMQANLLKKYIGYLPEQYSLPNIILTALWAYNKETIRFEEITFKARQGGENSINISRIIKIGWQSLKDFKVFREMML